MIEIRNVTFSYSGVKALNDISISIDAGEAVAFIGPNGSGKSTLMKLLNGIIFPDSGTYRFDGDEITERSMRDPGFSKLFHKRMGFVFQNPDVQLFCPSVYDEIAFGPRQMGLSEKETAARVSDVMGLLGVESLADRPPYHLSGGEKRKVAIACSLVLNPEVLALDEPMNGLDPKSKRFLRELLINLRGSNKTLLYSTHDFEYIEGVFERAVVFSSDHAVIRDDCFERVINDRDFLYRQNII